MTFHAYQPYTPGVPMDRFPQYPPHDDDSDGIPASDTDVLWMWVFLIGCTAVWALALLAVGYWVICAGFGV